MRNNDRQSLLFLPSEHFLICYLPRNPANGRGGGVRGVWNEALLQAYIDGLEKLYDAMIAAPWERDAPIVGEEGRTRVYVGVLDSVAIIPGGGSPFTALDRNDVPYIWLPGRTGEPRGPAELEWAMAVAIHEAVHLFNCRQRPLHDVNTANWNWFDEAMAIFIEAWLIPDNFDHYRFFGDWIALPHLSLDTPGAGYQAGRFAHYLSKKFNVEFVNRVWTESEPEEAPLEALERLALEKGEVFISSSPHVRDIFASGYCLDSWFLNDPESLFYSPELFERFGERALSESFELGPCDEASTEDTLDHLACRYYRFYLSDGASTFHIELRSVPAPFKAELAVVIGERRRLVVPLRSAGGDESGVETALAADLDRIGEYKPDYLLLVVTNCGARAAQINQAIEHDDVKSYIIEAKAG